MPLDAPAWPGSPLPPKRAASSTHGEPLDRRLRAFVRFQVQAPSSAKTLGWIERQWWTPSPTIASNVLRPLAAVYGALANFKRLRTPSAHVGVPVIVVGNLVVGGAGKTPTTIALVAALAQRGWRPGVVSRGYGGASTGVSAVTDDASAHDVGDEPLLIRRRTQVPVFVGRSRVDAARQLLRTHPDVNLIVADDGLQHHALHRDAQLIVIDERGFGNRLLLPAGPLRERPGPMPPPRSAVLYNADALSTAWPGDCSRRSLQGVQPWEAWLRAAAPSPEGLATLRGIPLVAAAGVAVPSRFFDGLRALGLSFEERPLPDHYDWRQAPPVPSGHALIVTEKDAVKFSADHPLATRLWVAPLDLALPEATVAQLISWLPAPRRAA